MADKYTRLTNLEVTGELLVNGKSTLKQQQADIKRGECECQVEATTVTGDSVPVSDYNQLVTDVKNMCDNINALLQYLELGYFPH